jgi:ABC-type multidrug transport system fused ATPase/permease subunit
MKILSQIQAAGIGDGVNGLIKGTGEIDWANYVRIAVGVMFMVAVGAVFAYLMWGAIDIITANGEKSRVENGRKKIVFAIMGLIVVAGAFAVWRVVLSLTGVDTVDFGDL